MIQAIKKFKSAFVVLGIVGTIFLPKVSYAYPVFAQNAYQNPREATGRIVCANCHLASKPVEIEVPQGVLPDTVFEAVVSIPYDTSVKQISAGGTKTTLNIGSVLVLPEGFLLAPKDRLSEEIKAKTKGVFVQPYSKEKPNILVVGPVAGDKKRCTSRHRIPSPFARSFSKQRC
jgi:apocytochrome f